MFEVPSVQEPIPKETAWANRPVVPVKEKPAGGLAPAGQDTPRAVGGLNMPSVVVPMQAA